jgi:endonuclease-3
VRGEPAASPAARAAEVLDLLDRQFPGAGVTLDFADPLQLLVATILSAQCTDERVNRVTPALFASYPDARAFAEADLPGLEGAIRSTGFFRNKARNIRDCCRALVERFGGKVPGSLEELVTLPGVGRKTANVVLGGAFGIPGITVDTHVGRLARRLGFSREEDPVKVEFDLMPLLPPGDWYRFSLLLIRHGRRTCTARKPACGECPVGHLCPSRVAA